MGIQYLRDGNFTDLRVFARFDFNVPFKRTKDGGKIIADTTRVDAAPPMSATKGF